MPKTKKQLSAQESDALRKILKMRFEQNNNLHQNIAWDAVEQKLLASPEKMWALNNMEQTGGEPDVVEFDKKTGECIFYDCAPESPKGRRSLCYDEAALKSRKEHKPKSSALQMAAEIGVEILTEEQYRKLQELGNFDLKTSSWVMTPPAIRKLGGAIFCDKRYNTVFTYHNGAESYYGSRGFRGCLNV